MKEILKKLPHIDDHLGIPRWLIILLGIVIVFRIPSLLEPYSYGDEMIYLTLGEGIRRGLTLYKSIHDNKPPLLYLIAAIAGNLFWFKAILTFWMVATIALFWKLTQTIFKEKVKLARMATIVFAILTTLPLLEGNIANSEIFMIGPVIAGLWILWRYEKTKSIFFAGCLFGIAALFKLPSVLDLPVIIIYWVITSKPTKENLFKIARKTFILGIGFLLPIIATFVWYFAKGALTDYLRIAFIQNIGYLSSMKPALSLPIYVRFGVVIIGLITLKVFRKKLSPAFMFATIWVLFTLFAAILSERPYPHYLIQVIPAASILIGILVSSTKLEQVYTVIPLFLVVLVPFYYKFYFYNPVTYYGRFLELATGQINKHEYFAKFDGNVNRNYEIADFLSKSSKQNDYVFVWGDSAPVYALSHRLPPFKYIANYHISDFSSKKEVMSSLTKTPPQFIVILPEGGEFKELKAYLTKNYIPVKIESNYEIWYKMKDTVKEELELLR